MGLLQRIFILLLASTSPILAASSWGFEDATLTIQVKGSGVGGGLKEKLSSSSALTSKPILFGAGDTLKIALTTTEGKSGKRAQQTFLTLHEHETGLEESFAFNVKDSGKAKIEITQKDLPHQFVTSKQPLRASIVVASFGSSTQFNRHAFDLTIETDPTAPPPVVSPPERYTSKPEIHHIFRDDPRSPPKIISLFFTLAILATVPALFGSWLLLGGNIDHAGKAFGANPVAHGLFFGSIVAMEGVFFMYYTSWNLFQTLPAAAIVGVVTFVSGSRALTEVQERRLAGER